MQTAAGLAIGADTCKGGAVDGEAWAIPCPWSNVGFGGLHVVGGWDAGQCRVKKPIEALSESLSCVARNADSCRSELCCSESECVHRDSLKAPTSRRSL